MGDGQRHIGGGDALTDRAGQVHAHDIGGQEIHRLAQHARLGLDAAHAPAHDAQTVDHGGVGIGAHQRVGIVHAAGAQDALGEVFQIDLVDDADARGNHLEGVEGLHAPLEELVALAVAGELQIEVLLQRVTGAGEVDLHRVVDHEVDRYQGLDDLGVLAQLGHRRAHGGEIHQQRHAGEVLQDDARHHEGNLGGPGFIGLPVGQFADIGLLNLQPVAVAEHALQHQSDGDREFGDRAHAGLFQGREAVELAGMAIAQIEGLQGVEQVVRGAH